MSPSHISFYKRVMRYTNPIPKKLDTEQIVNKKGMQ